MTPLMLLSLAVAAPVPKELRAPPPLFPTAVGTRWEYVEEATGKADHTREIVASAADTDGARVVQLRWTGSGYGDRSDYRVDATTVSWVGVVDGQVRARPYIQFKKDARAGEKWDAGIEPFGQNGQPVYTGVQDEPEDVKTPAGTFKAVRVRITYGNIDFWFAPGVGLVKWNQGGKVVVLGKFTPGRAEDKK